VRPTAEVDNLINCLTNDEDLRQDLWVHYLSGNSTESLSLHLDKIRTEYSDDIKLRNAIWQLIHNPPSDKLTNIIDNFTDFERSLICLLMLGLCVNKISVIKGISEVRIRQSIASIGYNSCWSIYGIEEKPIR
jgi:hypothetical protein